jgi:hypothetical protein
MKNIRDYIEHIRESKSANELNNKLVLAIKQRNIAECKRLIDAGADVNAKVVTNRSMLTHALRRNYLDVAKLLVIAGADIEDKDDLNNAALQYSISSKCDEEHYDFAKFLIDAGAVVDAGGFDGRTALYRAVSAGCLNTIKLFIDAGASVNKTDDEHSTPLHWAVHNMDFLNNKIDNIIKILIDAEANVNIKDKWGKTPLDHLMMRTFLMPRNNKILESVKLLILAGAEIDLKAQFGTFKRFSDFFGGNIKWVPIDLIPPEWRESTKFTGTFGGFY